MSPAGIGKPPTSYEKPRLNPGIATNLRKLALAIIDDPPEIASFLARLMTSVGIGLHLPADSRVVRMNPLIGPVRKKDAWALPGEMTPTDFRFLKHLDLDAMRPEEVSSTRLTFGSNTRPEINQ